MNRSLQNCRTFADFADAAAQAHQNSQASLPVDLGESSYAEMLDSVAVLKSALDVLRRPMIDDSALSLIEDLHVLVESDKDAWLRTRETDVDRRSLAAVVSRTVRDVEQEMHDIARGALFVRQIAMSLHLITNLPVVLLFNARGGTPYAYGFPDVPFVDEVDDLSSAIASGSTLMAMQTLKISSHEYVLTEDEARHLSGVAPWRQKVRTRFVDTVDGVTEHVPDALLQVFMHGFPVVYVDVPTWGTSYSTSTGLDRKEKDQQKWRAGVRRPYKMKCYADNADYATFAITASKYAYPTADSLIVSEELPPSSWIDQPICVIVNPRSEPRTPLWDNSPQFLGPIGHQYSPIAVPSGFEMLNSSAQLVTAPRDVEVRTTAGVMTLHEFARLRVVELVDAYQEHRFVRSDSSKSEI